MEYTGIDLPIEYWDKRKDFLKEARSWCCGGKVKMVKKKKCCTIIFYHNTDLYYLLNACINLGAWMKSNGYRTHYNSMIYD